MFREYPIFKNVITRNILVMGAVFSFYICIFVYLLFIIFICFFFFTYWKIRKVLTIVLARVFVRVPARVLARVFARVLVRVFARVLARVLDRVLLAWVLGGVLVRVFARVLARELPLMLVYLGEATRVTPIPNQLKLSQTLTGNNYRSSFPLCQFNVSKAIYFRQQ